jgi:hypothetical protein
MRLYEVEELASDLALSTNMSERLKSQLQSFSAVGKLDDTRGLKVFPSVLKKDAFHWLYFWTRDPTSHVLVY